MSDQITQMKQINDMAARNTPYAYQSAVTMKAGISTRISRITLAIVALFLSVGSVFAQGTISAETRRGEGFFDAPAQIQALTDEARWDAHLLSPFGQSFRDAVQGERFHAATITALLDSRGPDAVSGFVTAIIVAPLKSVKRTGLRPHVAQERSEIVGPLSAHGDSAQRVVLRAGAIHCEGAALSADPCAMFWSAGQRMCSGQCAGHFNSTASTARAESLRERVAINTLHGATLTATQPTARRVINDSPATEGATNHA